MDAARDQDQESIYEVHNELRMRARVSLGESSGAVLEARLRHQWLLRYDAAGRDALPGRLDDVGDQVALSRVELGEAYVSTRLGEGALLRVGQQRVVWGRTDLFRPADVLNPLDLWGGLGGEGGLQATAPIWMAKLNYIGRFSALELVLIPFFEPHRVGLLGGDFALLRSGSPFLSAGSPGVGLLGRLDPSLYEVWEPALLGGLGQPDQLPENASVGARVTTQVGGVDVGLGYLLGWDRVPTLRLDPALSELLSLALGPGGLLGGGFSRADLLRPENLRLLELVEEVSQRQAQGEVLVEAGYERWHVLELDVATTLGPLGVKADVAATPARNFLTERGRTARLASTQAALGLSWERGQGEVAVTAEGLWLRAFGAPRGEAVALFGDDFFALAAGLRLDLELLWGVPALFQVGGLVDLGRGDTILSPQLTWRLDEDTRLWGAAQWFVAPGGEGRSAGIGALADHNDQIGLGLEQGF